MIVALLHDVVEDSSLTIDELREKISLTAEEAQALKLLTHDKNVPYLEYIQNIKANGLARQVKLADIAHNMDTSRFVTASAEMLERVQKYKRAFQILTLERSFANGISTADNR